MSQCIALFGGMSHQFASILCIPPSVYRYTVILFTVCSSLPAPAPAATMHVPLRYYSRREDQQQVPAGDGPGPWLAPSSLPEELEQPRRCPHCRYLGGIHTHSSSRWIMTYAQQ